MAKKAGELEHQQFLVPAQAGNQDWWQSSLG